MKVSYSDLRQRISKALTMDVSNLSSSVVDSRVGAILDGYHTRLVTANLNGVFRARKNVGLQLFYNISELWYPKAQFVTRRGRFNEPNHPVFYACSRFNGALFEVRPQIGDRVTILVVRTKSPSLRVDCAHVGLERSPARELDAIRKTNILRNDDSFREGLERFGIYNKWLAVDDFISEISTSNFLENEEENKYKITNSISRTFFKMPYLTAMNYPSVAAALNCINICATTKFADESFVPHEVWTVAVDNIIDSLPGVNKAGPFYQTRFLHKSVDIDPTGRIQWSPELKNVHPSEVAHLAFP
jgi:hypothetical protein